MSAISLLVEYYMCLFNTANRLILEDRIRACVVLILLTYIITNSRPFYAISLDIRVNLLVINLKS